VAVKVIPASLNSDSIFRQRFQREARAISALQHPNICTLYDVGEQNGTDYLVMEYLQGETLASRLARTSLTVEHVLNYAIGITNALDAAHSRGITHRDLKPGNIFLTSQGECKVLDFGLAQMETDLSTDATTVAREELLTSPGATVGTVAYMSPEQARGDLLDTRTDIFSLGAVLYEMATRKSPYPGKTAALVFKAILDQTPSRPSLLNKSLPVQLDDVIGKSLEKDRELRYQSAAEMRADLKRIKRDSESGRINAMAVDSAPLGRTHISRAKWIFGSALAVIVIVAAAFAAYWWLKPSQAQVAFQHYRISRLTTTGNVRGLDLSRDGRYLAYTEFAGNSIFVQQIATATNVRILGPLPDCDLGTPKFSPDGNYIYYVRYDHKSSLAEIYRLPVVGGTPIKMVIGFNSLSVSPDGSKIAFSRTNRKVTPAEFNLIVANSDGSNQREVLTLKDPESINLTAWSADSQTIAFGIDEQAFRNANSLALVSAKGGSEHRIFHHMVTFGMAWLPDGSGLVLSSVGPDNAQFQLWVLSVPDGKLRRLTNDLSNYMDVTLTADGKNLGTRQKQMNSSIWVAPVSNPSQAVELPEAGSLDGVRGLAWLPEDRLAYMGSEEHPQIWQMDRDGEHRQPLTHLAGSSEDPSATSDGTTLAFTYANNIWRVSADGTDAKPITAGKRGIWNGEISPDGKWLTYFSNDGGPMKASVEGRNPVSLNPDGGYPTISPNGRWIAFEVWTANQQDRIEVVAADGSGAPRFLPFIPDEDQMPDASNMGVLPIRWTASGDALTYVRTKDGVSNLWMQPISGGQAKQVTNFTSGLIWRHAWSPDGKYLALARGNFSVDAVLLTDLR
jgi:Tol biopolymer transport system component